MKTHRSLVSLAVASGLLLTAWSARAADAKGYQVTGPVLEVTPAKIVVQKGEDRWEITRTKDSKVPADVKVGSKVTVYYTMIADQVEVKSDKAEKAEKGDKGDKARKEKK